MPNPKSSTSLGTIEALFRYPVKSMAGERLQAAFLGWHGIEGDRRLAVRRIGEQNGFPWLTGSKLPDLLRFKPLWQTTGEPRASLPALVRTPEGEELPTFGEKLAAVIEGRYGAPVQMMHLRSGIFDDACISVIATDTVAEICGRGGVTTDARRFRPNILLRLLKSSAFQEDGWVGGILSFGESAEAPGIHVTMLDPRCAMVNFDPEFATSSPEVMKCIVQMNQNNAGIYATVIRTGQLEVGQSVYFQPSTR